MSRSVAVTKLTVATAIAILIGWLWFGSDVSGQRFATLERLYRTGQLGHLEQGAEVEFRSRIIAVSAAAGIKTPLIIGAAPAIAHLHFYVTEPSLSWFTHCGKGNAVYDSELDAVFLDSSLWQPIELPKIGQSWPGNQQSQSFGFSRTFVDFILLHELGHRELHRSRWALFDVVSTDKGRQEEVEADGFAANALGIGYVKGLLGQDEDTLDELTEIGIDPKLGPRQRSIAALLYSTAQMSVGLLFSRGSFSSLYTDQSHPSFGQRVEHMSQVVAAASRDDPRMRPYLDYFQQVSRRIEEVRGHDFVEVHTQTPMEAAEFDERGLTIIDTTWKAWRVNSSELQRLRSISSVEPRLIGLVPISDPRTYVASTWSRPGEGVFIRSFDSEIFQINGDTISARPDLSGPASGKAAAVTIPAVQPSTTTVETDGSGLVVIRPDRVSYVSQQRDILSQIKNTLVPYDVRILDSTLIDEVVHVPIFEHSGPLPGCIEIDLAQSNQMQFVSLLLGSDVDGYGKLVAVQDGKATRHFMLAKYLLLWPSGNCLRNNCLRFEQLIPPSQANCPRTLHPYCAIRSSPMSRRFGCSLLTPSFWPWSAIPSTDSMCDPANSALRSILRQASTSSSATMDRLASMR